MKIDFVIPWVDGADPVWVEKRNQYSSAEEQIDVSRFRDWDILKFWFRAVEYYAPWVNKIHFVTDGQIPSWMNTSHPKLHIVDHKDYIPQHYLPTFSSHTIELNFHRIEGLAEHFVYFNDDMFLNAPVKPDEFFSNGLPKDSAILDMFLSHGCGDAYSHAQCNVMAFINKRFKLHNVLWSNPHLWFHPVYGKYLLKNIYFSLPKFFSNFQNGHLPSSMLKSTFETLWDMEPDLMDHTCRNRFRSLEDVNQYIFSYYNLCTGKLVPRSPSFGRYYQLGGDPANLLQDIRGATHKVICINDNSGVRNFEELQKCISTTYAAKFPEKSQYEL